MAKRSSNQERSQERTCLVVPRDEAYNRVLLQIEKANTVPNASVNENEEARRWYEFTAELLRRLFSTDELSDEFTGKGFISCDGDDITTGSYLKKLKSIYDRLELYPEDVSVARKCTSDDQVATIKKLIDKFHAVARQLKQRYMKRPTLEVTDEYDVQDLLHALLKINFDDIRSEEWTPSYAGGSSRMDFLLKAEKIVIEVKKTRSKLGIKEIGDQLAIDILRYRVHPDCKTLLCFVYDPEEQISNPKGLEQDLSQSVGEIQVRVYVAQR
ncbi:MAG: hypothetical protein V2A78_12130 [bacterium]